MLSVFGSVAPLLSNEGHIAKNKLHHFLLWSLITLSTTLIPSFISAHYSEGLNKLHFTTFCSDCY